MPHITRDHNGDLNIRKGKMKLYGQMLTVNMKAYYLTDEQLDDLYAVLHAREQAKQWKKAEPLLKRIEELNND